MVTVVTKADKLGKAQRPPVAAAAKRALNLRREPVLCSAQDDFGRDEL